ncbi:MAG: glycosyltransferase family 39 protein [Myxococcota bacterium]
MTRHTESSRAHSGSESSSEGPSESLWARLDGWWTAFEEVLADDRRAFWTVLAFGALVFLPRLGSVGLWDPWEVHYGEVAREMLARKDLVHPHWESAYFFSKPALPLWMMAFGFFVVGADATPIGEPLGAWTEWGARLPFALVAMGALWGAYRIGRLLGGRSTGVLAALILGACPQFIFIGKQAMADMPLVGFMVIGLAFFMDAVFGDEDGNRALPPLRDKLAMALVLSATGVGQAVLLASQVQGLGVLGVGAVGLASLGAVAVLWTVGRRRHQRLALFYAFMALAALSKGLAVLAIVGPTVLLYMVLAKDPGLLLRCGLLWGGPLFLLLGSPWYVVMSLFDGRDDEGMTFVRRFWFHDNFNRVGSGVHGDRGGLGYHLEQLAYGMFPWFALFPSAVLFAVRPREDEGLGRRRATLFVLIWAAWTWVFFSASLTKFHHYIFPAVPALAILVAAWFAWVAQDPRERLRGGMHIVIATLLAASAVDLVNTPSHLVNLFTYKYDRGWPSGVDAQSFIIALVAVGGVGLVAAHVFRQRGLQMLCYLAMGLVFGLWCSHWHFNMMSQHWSQYAVQETYYEERQPGERLYAYQLNWRGETFYSRNQVIQLMGKDANRRLRDLVDEPGREFILLEQSRFDTLQSVVPRKYRDKLRIIDQSNHSFYLVLVDE